MRKIKILGVALLTIMSLGACTAKQQNEHATEEQRWRAAIEICHEQAQDMTNSTVSLTDPFSNDYFRTCMRTRFSYTDDQLTRRTY